MPRAKKEQCSATKDKKGTLNLIKSRRRRENCNKAKRRKVILRSEEEKDLVTPGCESLRGKGKKGIALSLSGTQEEKKINLRETMILRRKKNEEVPRFFAQ